MFKIMAMYIVYLGMGHTLLCKTVKARTVKNYVSEAAKAIQNRRQQYMHTHPGIILPWLSPIRAHGETRLAPDISACYRELERWENMKDRREPLTIDMIYYQKSLCRPSTPHSLEQVMMNWEVAGIYGGFCLAEWAQNENVERRDQVNLTIDGFPMAFLISDLEFKGENNRRMTRHDAMQRPYLVQQVIVRWRFQKNGNINEKKTFVRVGGGDSTLCAVTAWMNIVQRWADLKLPEDHPLAVFTDTGLSTGKVEFITARHINDSLRAAATAVYDISDPKDLSRFSSHSIRVGACVALHAAGVSEQNIKFALRWKSNSFYTYLRNMPGQSARMASAVLNFNPDKFTLIPGRSV
jgi:hypothetical protein